MPMDKDSFALAVMRFLPVISDLRDRGMMELTAHQCYDDGYTLAEAMAYAACFEESGCGMEEEAGLKEMTRIRDNVRDRVRYQRQQIGDLLADMNGREVQAMYPALRTHS